MGRGRALSLWRRGGLLLAALFLMASSVRAQLHEAESGDVVMRSNVVGSMALAPEAASRHGVTRASDWAVLNVVLLRKGALPRENLRAQALTATVSGRGGNALAIPMREIVENDNVSYLGTFPFRPGEEVEVAIRAQPSGNAVALDLSYRETMPSVTLR